MRVDRRMSADRAAGFRGGIAVAVIAAIALATPAFAAAGSLLSGYGGPGQGSQQLLGSTLIGGAGSGGGSGASGSGGGSAGTGSGGSFGLGTASSSGSSPGGEQTQASSSTPRSVGGGGEKAAGGAGKGGGGAGAAGGGGTGYESRPVGGASIATAVAYPKVSAERAYLASAGSGSAGWEGKVWPYVLLVLAVLAFTGGLTSRLAKRKGPRGHRSLKGWVAGPE